MKLFRLSFGLMVVVLCLSQLFSCKKKAFKDGVGLYSVKQYHYYTILGSGDTAKLGTMQLGISLLDNNYISWNSITFHEVSTSGDSLATYVNDTSIGGVYTILYYLYYYPKKDSVTAFDNPTTKFWRSY